ncbi:GNAT family N-acetyltransferase [Phytohabitans aurantiacus]|uniref:N-acetyltransferase n=1 Tax=Phytohabitans aurantiacus TaxID=3016789 RepID=A0ABQ5QSQ2_9ACTN|nr:GNAT family N-acetyltransferase [Phytohabitans aurantiacus]GLH96621.1 N-acetyltransferase [Phytohabitans aurantiacus]
MRLQQLTAEHRDAILAFETLNRDYFAASVPDRGDDFFADYPARHAALLAMQAAGTDHFHVLVTEDGTIAGRVNLVCVEGGEAELGYRIGRDFAGRGLATDAVRQVCELAFAEYGLKRLRAATTVDNHGSRAVLLRNGFTVVGETTLDGQPALLFTRA